MNLDLFLMPLALCFIFPVLDPDGWASTVLPDDTESLSLSFTTSISVIFIVLSSFTVGRDELSVTILIFGTFALILYLFVLFFLFSGERENKKFIGPSILFFFIISSIILYIVLNLVLN